MLKEKKMLIDKYKNFEALVDIALEKDQMLMQDDVEIEIKKLNNQMNYFDLNIDNIKF